MFSYIVLNENYKYGEIIGSWNNWETGIEVSKPDFTIREFKFYIIDIDNVEKIHYKLKVRDEEFVLIEGYKTETVGEYDNNVLTIDRIREGIIETQDGINKIAIDIDYLRFYHHGILRFNGFIRMRQPFGFGTIYHESGKKSYEGNLRYGIKNGFGTSYYFRTGYKHYEGYHKNDRKHGYGISYNSNGEKRFEGKWEEDMAPEFVDSATETEVPKTTETSVMTDPQPSFIYRPPQPQSQPPQYVPQAQPQPVKQQDSDLAAILIVIIFGYIMYRFLSW